jgi:hypothetical protein
MVGFPAGARNVSLFKQARPNLEPKFSYTGSLSIGHELETHLHLVLRLNVPESIHNYTFIAW